MKTMVIYDSVFGNTGQVTKAIAGGLAAEEVKALKVGEVKPEDFTGVELLIVGSPTRQFRPTKELSEFLDKLPGGALHNVKVAAFDTRIAVAEVNSRLLNGMVKIFGYAAKPIADKLQKKGGTLVAQPEGFIVQGNEGPMRDGELERAAEWAGKISKSR